MRISGVLALFILIILLSISMVHSLVMEEGTMLNHDNVYYEFMDDVLLNNVSFVNGGVVFDGEHELRFTASQDLYIYVYEWNGLNHTLGVRSNQTQQVNYSILVGGEDYYFLSGQNLSSESFEVGQTEISWVYVSSSQDPGNIPSSGGGGSVVIPDEEEVDDSRDELFVISIPGFEEMINYVTDWYNGLDTATVNFLFLLLIFVLFVVWKRREEKHL